MGESAEMMMEGLLCQSCGEVIDGSETGYPRDCETCKSESDPLVIDDILNIIESHGYTADVEYNQPIDRIEVLISEDNYYHVVVDLENVLSVPVEKLMNEVGKEMNKLKQANMGTGNVIKEFSKRTESGRIEIIDWEMLEEMFTDITTQQSQYKWYGIEGLFLEQAFDDMGIGYYIVQEMTATELVKQSDSGYNIYERLVNIAPSDEGFEMVGVFYTEREARQYIDDNYELIDLSLEVESLLKRNRKEYWE